jgi:hypothetical protein
LNQPNETPEPTLREGNRFAVLAKNFRSTNSCRFHGAFINRSRTARIVSAFRQQPLKQNLMKSSVTNFVMALGLVAIAAATGAAGVYIGETDDAPGAALIGIVLMVGLVALGVSTARRKASHRC